MARAPAPVKNARNVVREVVRWAVPLGLAVVAAFVALVVLVAIVSIASALT